MWLIGVEKEQETSAPPPKKNPGSAPEMSGVNVKVERGLTFTSARAFQTLPLFYLRASARKITRQGRFPLSPFGWISTVA